MTLRRGCGRGWTRTVVAPATIAGYREIEAKRRILDMGVALLETHSPTIRQLRS